MYTYKIHLKKEAEGGYTVSVPVLPGCITYGEDVDGNQSMTLGTDTFGFVARNVPSRLFMYGFDVHFFERTNDGKITIMTISEKAQNSYE